MKARREMVITVGREVWECLLEKNKFTKADTAFVLLQEDCLKYWNKYLDEYMERKTPRRIFLLADLKYRKQIEELHRNCFCVLYIEEEKLISFSAFYTIFASGDNVWFLSLDLPFGRNTSSLLGLKGLTLEEMVYTGMMDLGELGIMKED